MNENDAIRPDQLLLPSVFDRLIDNELGKVDEAPRTRHQLLDDLKLCVRRDLERLLNTRISLIDCPAELSHLQTSVLNYGIPDIGGLAMGLRDQREKLRERVEDAIKRFETRFKFVRVEMLRENSISPSRTIHFRIEGTLFAEPAPEPVTFDLMVNVPLGEFKVRNVQS